MSYDLYVALGGNSQQDADALTQGSHRSIQVADIATRIRLLAGIAAQNESVKDYAVSGDRRSGGGYKSLVHARDPEQSVYAKALIAKQRPTLRTLGLLQPSMLLDSLPPGSWFLQFTFTLAKPWISKDDDPFYVAESVNPVRKDKVFKVPVMSAAAWKGLLRWTLMHTRLTLKKDSLTPERFAQERFVQPLLFGDEKGEESGGTKDFAAYLDSLKPQARPEYERLLRAYYGLKSDDPLPHHSGRLMFYPTFFDGIDVEVINPHSRETRAGTHPIYLECVPAGATGTFSLLYVPFDLIGRSEDEIKKQAGEDLQRVAEGLQAMFLTYGFSAKRTSGYGVAEESVANGFVQLGIEEAATPVAPPPAAEPQLPKYLQAPGKLKDEYLNPDGTFRERSQAELAKMSKSQRQEYEKARKWWEREGKALAEGAQAPPAPEEPSTPKPQWIKRSFASFDELVKVATSIAEQLTQGGER
ncbi:MAG: CRISPR-associated protein [Chloroflexota bacterium]